MSICPNCGHTPLPPETASCPRCQAPLDSHRSATGAVEGTRLESVEDLRRWMNPSAASDTPTKPTSSKTQKPTSQTPPPAQVESDDAKPFRPTARPPMLVVCIVDEGKNGGEWRRVRADRALIGRAEGDFVIAHDAGISGRHAELVRLEAAGRFRWWLRDLESTNGTLVRVTTAPLEHGQEFLIGMRRFRFDAAVAAAPPADVSAAARNSTRGWQVVTPADAARLVPSLVELTPGGEGARTPLAAAEHWIGSDRACSVVLSGDPFASRRHARLVRGPQGRWQIENGASRNGTWLRVREVPIDSTAEFQAGEQRFLVKVC